MKSIIIYTLSIASLIFLTSCSSVNGGCGRCNGCCQTAVVKYPCKVIVDRCEKICNACTFGGPACTTCWACINYMGCNGSCKSCGYSL